MNEELWHNRQIVFDRYFKVAFGSLVVIIAGLSFLLIKTPQSSASPVAQGTANPLIDEQIKQIEQGTVKGAQAIQAGPVNLKTATETELDRLDGIGEKRASQIVSLRAEGKITSVNDLQKVKGIGEKLFEAIKDQVVWE